MIAIHTGSAGTTDHQTELDTLLDIFLATELDLEYEIGFTMVRN